VLGCSGGIESEMAFIKDVADLTAFWFIDPKDQQFFALLEENFRGFEDYDLIPVLIHQRQRLATALMTL